MYVCVHMLLFKIVKIAHKVAPHIHYNCNQYSTLHNGGYKIMVEQIM